MKRDSVSAFVHMKRDTPLSLYPSVNILDEPPSIPIVMYILNGRPISQPKDKYRNASIKRPLE